MSGNATVGLFQTESFDSHSKKFATVAESPHKGDIVHLPASCALTPECRQAFEGEKKKRSFQKYVTSLHAQWASLKKHSVWQKGLVGAYSSILKYLPLVHATGKWGNVAIVRKLGAAKDEYLYCFCKCRVLTAQVTHKNQGYQIKTRICKDGPANM